MRYMPTLRCPLRGSRVITAGSVMNGAASPGQQVWIGSAPRSTSSPRRTISWHAPLRTVFGTRVGDRLQLLQAAHLLDETLRRLHLEHVGELRRHVVEPLDAEGEAHPPLGAELVDEQRMARCPSAARRGAPGRRPSPSGRRSRSPRGADRPRRRRGRARPRARGARSTRADQQAGATVRRALVRAGAGAALARLAAVADPLGELADRRSRPGRRVPVISIP